MSSFARRYDWWDYGATWNPVSGCEHTSPGCSRCYAAVQAGTLHQESGAERQITPRYDGVTKLVNGRHVFNGVLKAAPRGHAVWTWPLNWKGAEHPLLGPRRPSLIFVCDMCDLFIAGRSERDINRVLWTAAASKHIGMLLTKHPARMAEHLAAVPPRARRKWQAHLWLGFSAENQAWFDRRWPHMRPLAAAGWTCFVSLAPMLGPVVLPPSFLALGRRGWAILSGEQGPHARCRDADPAWMRAVVRQCRAARLPVFVKQLARRAPIPPDLWVREFPAVRSES